MNIVRRLTLALSLTAVIAGTALAGEVNTPPCTTDPGEVNTPPCPSSQYVADDNAEATSLATEIEALAVEAGISVLENVLTIY